MTIPEGKVTVIVGANACASRPGRCGPAHQVEVLDLRADLDQHEGRTNVLVLPVPAGRRRTVPARS